MRLHHRLFAIALACLAVHAGALPAQSASDGRPTPATRGHRVLKRALIGTAVGATAGLVFGANAPASCCVPFGWTRVEATALWTGIGAASGAIVGSVVGMSARASKPAQFRGFPDAADARGPWVRPVALAREGEPRDERPIPKRLQLHADVRRLPVDYGRGRNRNN